MTTRKALLGLAAAALLLGGCATPYYGPQYAYDDGRYNERPVPDTYANSTPVYPYYGPSYYPYYPYYYGPSVSFGLAFSNRGYHHRHW
jgi:hypothetical protein